MFVELVVVAVELPKHGDVICMGDGKKSESDVGNESNKPFILNAIQ